ncbi:hypothetical protein C5C50_00925 [Rathayibacter sp. AY1D9]|nr:hypothetical protein C5C50_00925 [Rathayibacter sp. AY1D9]
MAVNRTVTALGLEKIAAATATVDLARNLARRMDSAPAGVAPSTLVSQYQSALKDLDRAGRRAGILKPERDADEMTAPDSLEAFFRKWRVRPEDRGE